MEKPKGLRFNEGKPKWSLVDFKSLEPMIEVLMYGAHKYSSFKDKDGVEYTGAEISVVKASEMTQTYSGANNWKGGMNITEIFESLMRHLVAYMDGEGYDKESGYKHLGHAMANLMFMIYNDREKPQFDDRENKRTADGELVEDYINRYF